MTVPTDPLERWGLVGHRFTAVADAVPDDAWDSPAPCEGWVARDVVRHLVEWVPGFLEAGAGVELAPGPSIDTDPSGAWRSIASQIEELLHEPTRPFSHPHAGDHPLGTAIDQFITGDVLVHTWDLATATRQAPGIDEEIALEATLGMAAITDMLVASGHFSEPVPVPPDADPVTKLVAITGRDPNWTPGPQ
jgi:uncharacterized protein (TIGR03086 family)